MKKFISLLAVLCGLLQGRADIHVTAAGQWKDAPLKVNAVSLHDVMTKNRRDLVPAVTNVKVREQFVIRTPGKEPQRYTILLGEEMVKQFYAQPTDTVYMKIDRYGNVTVTGTELLDQVAAIEPGINKTMKLYEQAANNNDEKAARLLLRSVNTALGRYVSKHPDHPGATWAVLQMEPDEMVKYAAMLKGGATECIIFPLVEKLTGVTRTHNQQMQNEQEMAAGLKMAPLFTLPDLNGKLVKLKNFKGKWVVLDFWGSWCQWCIMEFRDMKKMYANYKGKLEIIGIDCNDSEEHWRSAVKRFQLPWVNVYNRPGNKTIIRDYNITAFPTKILINPQGKIQKIYIGENPGFYTDLAKFIK